MHTLCRAFALAMPLLWISACNDGSSSGGTAPPVSNPFVNPSGPTLDAVPPVTAESHVTIRGTALFPGDVLRVEGGAAAVEVTAGDDGRFGVEVPLRANARNQLFVVERFQSEEESPPVSVVVAQDGVPPEVFIDFPVEGATVAAGAVAVTGRVLEPLSGGSQVTVSVNGAVAALLPGPGGTATFELEGLDLPDGAATLVARAEDAAGNRSSAQVNVQVASSEGDRLVMFGGQAQEGAAGDWLDEPVRVRALRANGSPFVGKVVQWRVSRSDGRVAPDGQTKGSLALTTLTDSSGVASVRWRLGLDAGRGNQRLEVSSADLDGGITFIASAMPGVPAQLGVGRGGEQAVPAGGLALEPLTAWLSDGANGVQGVDVEFRVVSGGGTLIADDVAQGSLAIVRTGATGHASVALLTGETPGQNVVEARVVDDTLGLDGELVSFRVDGLPRSGSTTFEGLVLDGSSRPILGTTAELVAPDGTVLTTTTDTSGRFVFEDLIEPGLHHLEIDGSTASSFGSVAIDQGTQRLPELHYEPFVAAGVANRLTRAIRLPILERVNDVVWDGQEDVELTVAGVEGLTMTVRAGSMVLPDGSVPSPGAPVTLALNQVHADDIPMRPDDGASSRLAWTLQPGGSTFDPPVDVCYPNVNGLEPGATAFLLSFDHDTNRFEVVGSARVDDDGACVRSDPGSGLSVAGWGGQCPPYANTGTVERDKLESAKDTLVEHWQETADTPLGPLNEQIACLAARACGLTGLDDTSPDPERPEWSEGWIADVLGCVAADIENDAFHWSSTNDLVLELCDRLEGNPALAVLSFLGIMDLDDVCSILGGGQHFLVGLFPCFLRNCEAIREDEQRAEDLGVDSAHEQFFDEAVIDCFRQVEGFSPDVAQAAEGAVPIGAAATRELVLALCDLKPYWNDLFGSGDGESALDGPEVGYPAFPEAPRAEDFRSEGLASLATMDLGATGFDVVVGQPVQLTVTKSLPGGGTVDVTSDPDTMWMVVDAGMDARVDAGGELLVSFCSSAFISVSRPLYVFAVNGEDVAVGQFAVHGQDADGDGIVNHFEEFAGMDPLGFNGPLSDLDGDGLADFVECMYLTSPAERDTDGDGVEDALEVFLGSDPLNPAETAGDIRGGCEITVAGQVVTTALDGSFRVDNVPSDGSLMRAAATCVRGDVALYARSQAFGLAPSEVRAVTALPPSTTPPPSVVTLTAEAQPSLLTAAQPLGAMAVTGAMSDGTTRDLTLRVEGTSYVSSNPAVVAIGPDGELQAVGTGEAFVTAFSDGAIAVTSVRALLDAGTTSVVGFARDVDGGALAAVVEVLGQGLQATAGPDGRFELTDVVADPDGIVLRARATVDGSVLAALSAPLDPVEDGFTDAGVLTLDASSTAGQDFTVCFPRNFAAASSLQLFVASQAPTSGQVRCPGISWTANFSVQPGQVTTVEVPLQAELSTTDGLENLAVHVEADSDICLYGMTQRAFTTDAFAALPVNTFGTDFYAVGTPGLGSTSSATQLAVVAANDGTTVTITPAVELNGHPAGVPYTVTIDRDETYQLASAVGDVTGTRVMSDMPIGVLSGSRCAQVPFGVDYCDTVLEMLPPVPTWGSQVPLVSLAGREGGDTIKIVAAQDDTAISITGDDPSDHVLQEGEVLEIIVEGVNLCTATGPILVVQLSHGSSYDSRRGDPFSMLLAPQSQYQADYVFTTPASGFVDHYINVVAPASVAESEEVLLDGVAVAAGEFVAIPGSPLAAARIAITEGSHELAAPAPIGVTVYGFNNDDSYGYTGGMLLTTD